MEKFTQVFNILNAVGSLVFILFGLVVLYFLIFNRENIFFLWVKKYILPISLVVSLLTVFGSLTYSLIIGYDPCTLCWAQRIFVFPISIMLLTALWYKKSDVFLYMLPILSIGILFSIYHNVVYMLDISPVFCSALVSCNSIYVFEFGFVTIPFMSFTAFFVLIILSIVGLKKYKEFSPQ
jgi:disulfide bond formation protein DsbB